MSTATRWLVVLGVLSALPAHAAEDPLAGQARAVLERHCHSCHGRGGIAKGGFGFILDRDQLVSHKKIVPGKPDDSELYQRLLKGEMPPKGKSPRPTPRDIALVKQWIVAGAPTTPIPPRTFVSNALLHRLLHEDLQGVPARQRRFIRYISFSHLANAGRPAAELRTAREALSLLVNSLSWHPRLSVPAPVDREQTVFRIDLRHYRWNARTWERLVTAYPYRVPPVVPDARTVASETGCDDFLLRGDWFVANVSRGKLYFDTLEMPATDRALERLLQVDAARDLREETVVRAGFNGSGVSKNNRVIQRHDAAFGAYWRSHDFSDNTGRQNVFEYPLGPAAGKASFRPAGGEIIFNLPNGLQGFMLVDGAGRRVERAPVEIVSDPQRPDRQVEVGISCLSCHARGLIPKDDQVRAHVERNPTAFARADVDRIKALYPPVATFRTLMERDTKRYLAALAGTGASADPSPVLAVTLRYEGVVDLAAAAAEIGVRPDALTGYLARSPALKRTLGPLQATGTVQRQVFEEVFPQLMRDLRSDKTVATRPALAPEAFAGHTEAVLCVTLSPDGRLALSGGQDHSVRLWEVSTGRQRHRLEGHSDAVRAVAFSPDSRFALSASDDRTVRLWDLQTGKEQRRLTGHVDRVRAVVFSADGKHALSAGDDRTVRLWDVATGKEQRSLAGHPRAVTCVAFAPDGRRALSGSADGSVRLWDLASGKEVLAWQGNIRGVRCLVFSADGKRALSGGEDRVVRLWDLSTGKQIRPFEGHATAVLFVSFSAGGERVFSAGGQNETPDTFLRTWDSGTGKEVARLDGEGRVWCAVISADGSLALTGGTDRSLRVWRLSKR